jgi:hypothetical protein
MSDLAVSGACDFGHLRLGIAIASIPGRQIRLEAPVTRILRIALFVLAPMFALGALASGCGDDTTSTPDLATTVKPDMAVKPAVDMASHD